MAKECNYKFSNETPSYTIEDYQVYDGTDSTKKGNLVLTKRVVRGLAIFGPQAGVLTEDKLTDPIAEFIMTKEAFSKYIVLKDEKPKDKK